MPKIYDVYVYMPPKRAKLRGGFKKKEDAIDYANYVAKNYAHPYSESVKVVSRKTLRKVS